MAAPSQPTVNVSKLEMSACKLLWKGPGESTYRDLGATLDNVVMEFKYTKGDIKADQYGPGTTVDRRVTGTEITISTALAQVKDFDLLQVIFPHVVPVTAGPLEAVDFLNRCGEADLSVAGSLVVHPLALDDSDESCDLSIPLAVAQAESALTWGAAEQAKFPIKWNVLPDTSATGTGGAPRWGRYGAPRL